MSSIINNPLIGPLIKSSTVRLYTKGQTVIYPDDQGPTLYLIKNGAVSMDTINEAGDRKILYIFGPSSLFPMTSFLDKTVTSSWFYTTLIDTELYVIPYEELVEKLKEVDGFTAYNALLSQILSEVHELLLHISDHAKTDSNEKLISMLLFLLEHHTRRTSSPWRTVRFPVTHQLLADMTGLTRETVSLGLKEFAAKRLLRYKERGKLELNVAHFEKQTHA